MVSVALFCFFIGEIFQLVLIYAVSTEITMSKKKKSAVLIESDSDDSDSGKDFAEVHIPRIMVRYRAGMVPRHRGYATAKFHNKWPVRTHHNSVFEYALTGYD